MFAQMIGQPKGRSLLVMNLLVFSYFRSDITVTSTLIRDLMSKLDELNNTMTTRVEELNGTVMELQEKNRQLEGNLSFTGFHWLSLLKYDLNPFGNNFMEIDTVQFKIFYFCFLNVHTVFIQSSGQQTLKLNII